MSKEDHHLRCMVILVSMLDRYALVAKDRRAIEQLQAEAERAGMTLVKIKKPEGLDEATACDPARN